MKLTIAYDCDGGWVGGLLNGNMAPLDVTQNIMNCWQRMSFVCRLFLFLFECHISSR